MKTTLHVLANPYGITHTRYRMDPFNVAVLKFIENMQLRDDYEIIHYGHESSLVPCENVIAVTNAELPPPSNDDAMFFERDNLSKIFMQKTNAEIARRKKPKDMVLCFYGWAHHEIMDQHKDLHIVEPSIGYPLSSVFAPYRGFVSYSQMHYYYGMHNMMMTPSWYDAVIPNAFTPSEFEVSNNKEDYVVYLGRIIQSKGIDLCIQVTQALNKRLIIAGPGNLRDLNYTSIPNHVEMVGYVNPEQRKNLLSKASCLMAPTYYLEPFGNIVAEAQFCGTPVVTSDWGGFVDSVLPGITGYRCKDFKSFCDAVNSVHLLDTGTIRAWAEQQFSDTVVHDQFHTWLQKILTDNFYHV